MSSEYDYWNQSSCTRHCQQCHFDPVNRHKGAWHWFANTRVKTLWQAAKEAGYIVGSAAFPTSVGAKGDFIAPEFWWDGSYLDSAFIDVVAHPQGLISEMEKDIGTYAGGLDLSDHGDQQRYKAAEWLLTHKLAGHDKPFFLSAYLLVSMKVHIPMAFIVKKLQTAWKDRCHGGTVSSKSR